MASRFKFTLQKVLDYRVQLEEQARLELAKAQNVFSRQADLCQSIRDEISRILEESSREKRLDRDEMWLWRNYETRLREDLKKGETKLLELARILNQKRREAVVRARDRKLLEKLKAKQAKRHEDERKLSEQREFDEMAAIRHSPWSI